jgi:hypothetical protein
MNNHFGGYNTKIAPKKEEKKKKPNSEFSKIWKNGNKT